MGPSAEATRDAASRRAEKQAIYSSSVSKVKFARILQQIDIKIPVWWRRAVLPPLPWVVGFLSFFLPSPSRLLYVDLTIEFYKENFITKLPRD